MSDWSNTYGYGHVHVTPTWADHTHSISHTHSINPIYTQAKEPEMTTLEKIRAERRDARERGRIEQMYAAYDEADLDGYESGMVLRFSWTPEGAEKTYEYAALWANERWYVTGRESPNGLVTEDFVAWLIGKDVAVADLIELVAA